MNSRSVTLRVARSVPRKHSSRRRRGSFLGFAKALARRGTLHLCLLLATASPIRATDSGAGCDYRFRMGLSTALMPEINQNDAKAAMKFWVTSVLRDSPIRANPDMLLAARLDEIVAALESRTIDGVALAATEFFALREQVKFGRSTFGSYGGDSTEEYVLLVGQDSNLQRVEDLQGRTLTVLRHSRMCLALPWLETLLLEKGKKAVAQFCQRITEESKLAKVVLPVFFKQSDACLVTRKGLNAMGELNPRVIRQLRVLASSEKFVPTGFFFRADAPAAELDQFLGELNRLHERPSGQQVLTVFQIDRMTDFPISVLDGAMALLDKHRRLSAGLPGPTPDSADASQADPRRQSK